MIASVRPLAGLMQQIDRLIPPALRALPRHRQAARHLALLAVLAAASAPPLAVLYHVLGLDPAGMAVLGGVAVMIAVPLALRAGASLAVARDLFIAALFVLKAWLALHLGGIGAPTVSWFILCPMIALLLGGLRPGLMWAGIVGATLFALFAAGRGGMAMQAWPVADPGLLDLASHAGLAVMASVIVVLAAQRAGHP